MHKYIKYIVFVNEQLLGNNFYISQGLFVCTYFQVMQALIVLFVHRWMVSSTTI